MSETLAVTATVTRTQPLGENLVRVSAAGPQLWGLPWGPQGPGPRADAYCKVLIPPPGGEHVTVDDSDLVRWRHDYMAASPADRGWMRTYTLRDARTVTLEDRTTVPEIDIDVVLHADHETGHLGPGARWGANAAPGDTTQLLVPSVDSAWWAGWDEQRAAHHDVVIAADETALPAATAIVECADTSIGLDPRRTDFPGPPRTLLVAVEVPTAGDTTTSAGPAALRRGTVEGRSIRVTLDSGAELVWTWLPRDGRQRNELLELWMWEQLERLADTAPVVHHRAPGDPEDEQPTDFVWATASGSGKGPYWFLAGESSTVKSLRRMCVAHGVEKSDISFMGYWKQGHPTE